MHHHQGSPCSMAAIGWLMRSLNCLLWKRRCKEAFLTNQKHESRQRSQQRRSTWRGWSTTSFAMTNDGTSFPQRKHSIG